MFLRSFIYFVWKFSFLPSRLRQKRESFLWCLCQVIASELLSFGRSPFGSTQFTLFSCALRSMFICCCPCWALFCLERFPAYNGYYKIIRFQCYGYGERNCNHADKQTEPTKSNFGDSVYPWHISPFHSYFNLNRILISIWMPASTMPGTCMAIISIYTKRNRLQRPKRMCVFDEISI